MKNPGLIALSTQFNPLRPQNFNANNTDIEFIIATLSPKGTPQNFSFDRQMDFPKTCTGGCHARIWASETSGQVYHYFSHYGPDVTYGDSLADYEYALRAYKTVRRYSDAIYKIRGSTNDAATLAGQWLEACGIEKVWTRPDSSKHVSWLNEGDWEQWDIGRTVNEIRARYYKLPELQPA